MLCPRGRTPHQPADLLRDATSILTSCATEVDYDLPATTTAGRYWVRVRARSGADELPFALFVKHVHSWARSAFFEMVPTELRDFAEAGVPWRTEHRAYRSDLGDCLPKGLAMPRAVGVHDLDEKSAVIWLEVVETKQVAWDLDRYARAAYLLGRLAGSPTVRKRACIGAFTWSVESYLHGRLDMHALAMLRDPGVWEHPLVAALRAMPEGTIHGDACPNNLLTPAASEGFVLIDYGF